MYFGLKFFAGSGEREDCFREIALECLELTLNTRLWCVWKVVFTPNSLWKLEEVSSLGFSIVAARVTLIGVIFKPSSCGVLRPGVQDFSSHKYAVFRRFALAFIIRPGLINL